MAVASGRMMFNELRDEEFEGPRDVAQQNPIEDIPNPLDDVPAPRTFEIRSFAAHAKLRPLTDLLVIPETMADTVVEKDNNEAVSGAGESAQQTAAVGGESDPAPCSDADKSCAHVRASSCMAGSFALSRRTQRRALQRGCSAKPSTARPAPEGPSTSSRGGLKVSTDVPAGPSADAPHMPVAPSTPPSAQGRRPLPGAARQVPMCLGSSRGPQKVIRGR